MYYKTHTFFIILVKYYVKRKWGISFFISPMGWKEKHVMTCKAIQKLHKYNFILLHKFIWISKKEITWRFLQYNDLNFRNKSTAVR